MGAAENFIIRKGWKTIGKAFSGKNRYRDGSGQGHRKGSGIEIRPGGADVVMLDILEKELKESKAEVEAFGTKVEAIAADLRWKTW